MRFLLKLTLLIFVGVVVSACSISEERAQELAETFFEEKITQEPKTITYESDNISLYIPSYTDVDEVDEHNLILERSGHTYLLFLNDVTDFQSKEELLDFMMVEEDPFIFHMDEVDGKTTYLVVTEFSEEDYKVVVGHNGNKITTITTLRELNNVSTIMFDIVQSIRESNE
ncbi:MAG: hypothetical protein LRY73_09030 [Bacillus sp. (in: Bacteria)]|nr:hypothetical protein [Bacillus sp. (in: firmicutes)]